MSDAIESLYFGGKRLNLSESDESNDNSTSAEFERAVKFVHESEGFASADIASDEVLPLVKATYKELSEAVVDGITDSSVRYAVPDAMKYNLLKDTWMFSGMKTYHELKQCALLLLDGDGKLKSFSKFRKTYGLSPTTNASSGCVPSTTQPCSEHTGLPSTGSLRRRRTYCQTSSGHRRPHTLRAKTTVRFGAWCVLSATGFGKSIDRATAGTANADGSRPTARRQVCRRYPLR